METMISRPPFSLQSKIFSIVYTKRLRKVMKILVAVVIGALLLAGLYALFGETIMPTLKTKIEGLFNYKG